MRAASRSRQACEQALKACTCTRTLATVAPRTPIPPQAKRKARADDERLSLTDLSLLHSSLNAPAESALFAFANRLALPYASDVALVEQTLIHPSFWVAVLNLNRVDSTLTFTHRHDADLANNEALATLGNTLLGSFALEKLMQTFPRLPTRTLKAALTMYVGPKSLALAARSWGIAPTRLERESIGVEKERLSRKEKAYGHLVEGRGGGRKQDVAPGASPAIERGLLRWDRRKDNMKDAAILFEDALASSVRATVGAIFQTSGFEATRTFVHKHLLPISPSHIVPLLKWTDPHKYLGTLVPGARNALLTESGRLSAHATFLAGTFGAPPSTIPSPATETGSEPAARREVQLGEGFGSSIKMANWRAAEDALRRFFLSSRRDPWRYSEADATPLRSGLPSDTWTGSKQWSGWSDLLDHEEVLQSKGKGQKVDGGPSKSAHDKS